MNVPPKGTMARQHLILLVLCRRVGRDISRAIDPFLYWLNGKLS